MVYGKTSKAVLVFLIDNGREVRKSYFARSDLSQSRLSLHHYFIFLSKKYPTYLLQRKVSRTWDELYAHLSTITIQIRFLLGLNLRLTCGEGLE